MHLVERDIMMGAISVLNESFKKAILTEEQHNTRLAELTEFEKEMNFMFLNSPNCPIDLQSVIEVSNNTQNINECNNIEDITEFANQKDMLVYVDVDGANMSITYTNGVLTKISVDNLLIDIKKIYNIPYKINKKGTYTVQGKVFTSDKTKLIIHNVIKDDGTNLKKDLGEAKDLGFDVVPNWLATNFNPKNLQGNIDYIFEYAADEELPCIGIVFKFNNKKDKRCIRYTAH